MAKGPMELKGRKAKRKPWTHLSTRPAHPSTSAAASPARANQSRSTHPPTHLSSRLASLTESKPPARKMRAMHEAVVLSESCVGLLGGEGGWGGVEGNKIMVGRGVQMPSHVRTQGHGMCTLSMCEPARLQKLPRYFIAIGF
jgi:hypothetical protein